MSAQRGSATPSRRSGAHERLIQAVTDVAARDGYVKLTVARVLAAAGVSRATFYQYFTNIDDCFRSAYRHHADRIVADVAGAQRSRRPGLGALDALLAAVASRPDAALLLMREGLAAGPSGLCERDALIARVERVMAGSAAAHDCTVDVPSPILIGATFRFLAMRLTERGPIDALGEELRQWLEVFARSSSRPAWSARLTPDPPRCRSRSPAAPSAKRPPGTRRERILYATAAAIRANGYRHVSVADIARVAGVSRRGFYNEFPSKADAFMAAYEHGFQQTLAACAPAFFGASAWPERVWHGAHAFTGFLASAPLIAYLGFVDCYALGADFASRVHETQLAFTLFLEDGYRQRPQGQSLSRACSALTAAAVIELGFQVARHGPGASLRRVQPLAVYIALAPFIGVDEAGDFVMGRLLGHASSAS